MARPPAVTAKIRLAVRSDAAEIMLVRREAVIENLAFQATPYLVCEASLNAEGFYKANGYAEEGRNDRVSRSGSFPRSCG